MDNDPRQTSKVGAEWLKANKVMVLEWTTQNTDLNTIENNGRSGQKACSSSECVTVNVNCGKKLNGNMFTMCFLNFSTTTVHSSITTLCIVTLYWLLIHIDRKSDLTGVVNNVEQCPHHFTTASLKLIMGKVFWDPDILSLCRSGFKALNHSWPVADW